VPVEEELRLRDEPDAAARARRFATRMLATARLEHPAETTVDVELIVSELVTNARLHAAPPIVVRVRPLPDGVRIEVADESRSAPMRGVPSVDGMTGRGIALVEALARRWGIEPTAGGKVVWCEVGDRAWLGAADSWGLQPGPIEQPGDEPRVTVRLGDVPTDLLLAAKAHVDNVVREFTLAAVGAEAGTAGAVPPDLAQLIETV
jgi:anti-sigma regulatory factor (Ser/Thr protein kinase)